MAKKPTPPKPTPPAEVFPPGIQVTRSEADLPEHSKLARPEPEKKRQVNLSDTARAELVAEVHYAIDNAIALLHVLDTRTDHRIGRAQFAKASANIAAQRSLIL